MSDAGGTPSIESSGYPLVFRVAGLPVVADETPGTTWLRTEVRALTGMQKEAVVTLGASGRRWRMVSDEGPYLNGTDLAPFPLAFYTAGMQFCFLSRLRQVARARGVDIGSPTLAQDNFYSMEGSFLRGDAKGGAMPAVIEVSIESSADPDTVAELVRLAEATSPAQALMREELANTFSLAHNRDGSDAGAPPGAGTGSSDAASGDPHGGIAEPVFDGIEPEGIQEPLAIIRKVAEAEHVVGVDGGAGSSLRAEQKRTLHIHGAARATGGGSMETLIRLLEPIGSSFHFRCEDVAELEGGHEASPPPLAYLAAGIGFCFMTQLGRYSAILKKELASYSLVQDTRFRFSGAVEDGTSRVGADPVETHVFMRSGLSLDEARDFVSTGERTCFLHAAMREVVPSEIHVRLNGDDITDRLAAPA